MKIPDEMARRIDGYVTKYMGILQIDGERPSIELRNNPRVDWVGRSDSHAGRPGHPPATTIELQKRLFENDRFLERVIAHEMVHHRNYLAATEDEKHGAAFREGAARINAIMGPDFVVEAITPPSAESCLSTALIVTAGVGGLAFLAAALLAPKPSTMPSTPPHVNERGTYGKK